VKRMALVPLLAWGLGAETARVTVLATTDLHGYLYPYDYFTSRPAERGLAKIATLVRAVRAEDPRAILIDCGDTIQGSPLEGLYQARVRDGRPFPGLAAGLPPDPMMLAMNELGYSAMVLGNHELNFGLGNLAKARGAARFPWISANTVAAGGAARFEGHVMVQAGAIRVALIGITTPAIPHWEKPENYRGYRWMDGVEAARQAVQRVRGERPDLVIAAMHSGLDRDAATGVARGSHLPGENVAYQVASRVPGIDAVVFGHTHLELPTATVNGVLMAQPRNWGMSLARLDFVLERAEVGPWRVAAKSSRVIPVTAEVAADRAILEIARPYHEAVEAQLAAPFSTSPAELAGMFGRVEDTAALQAIHQVQLHYAKADVSFAALFNPRVVIPRGAVSIRQAAALYLYDNELYAIEGTGRMVRLALENAARYFGACPEGPCGFNAAVPGFNYDTAAGVSYVIDVSRPEGSRIRDLTYRGRPLEDGRRLRIAVNNYRAAGSGGYEMFRGARVVWRSGAEIRDLLIEYFSSRPFPAEPAGNWRLHPPEAARRLREAAGREAALPRTQ